MQEDINLLQIIIHALIALTAGIMKELNQISKKGFNIIQVIASGAVSSFVGVTVFFLLQHFDVAPYLTAFCTSIAGWMGGSIMDYFGVVSKRYVIKKLDVMDVEDIDTEKEEKEEKEDKQ